MSAPEPIQTRPRFQFSLRMLFAAILLSSLGFLFAKPWLFPPPHFGVCSGSQGLFVKGCCASLQQRLVKQSVLLPVPSRYSRIVQDTIRSAGLADEADVTPFLVLRGSEEFLMLLRCKEWSGGENVEVVVIKEGRRSVPLRQLSLLAENEVQWFCDLLSQEQMRQEAGE